jgi:hypothetical protein
MTTLRNKLVRLASTLEGNDRKALLTVLAAKAKAPAKLKGKKLDNEINRLFRIHGDRVEFNIFDLSKVTKDVAAAYAAGGDMEEAMKKAVAKYRQN